MNAKTMGLLAVIVSMLFGLGFLLVPDSARSVYSTAGGAAVAVMWMAVGYLGYGPGRSDRDRA